MLRVGTLQEQEGIKQLWSIRGDKEPINDEVAVSVVVSADSFNVVISAYDEVTSSDHQRGSAGIHEAAINAANLVTGWLDLNDDRAQELTALIASAYAKEVGLSGVARLGAKDSANRPYLRLVDKATKTYCLFWREGDLTLGFAFEADTALQVSRVARLTANVTIRAINDAIKLLGRVANG